MVHVKKKNTCFYLYNWNNEYNISEIKNKQNMIKGLRFDICDVMDWQCLKG